MRLTKSACALLLGGGLSVLNIGCAAVDAIVSSPAGYSAGSGSPQRIAAVGRVFENQGRYTQARAMYRQALRSDPNNSTARDRLEYLASLQAPASRKAATADAFAIADTVAPPKTAGSAKSRRQPATGMDVRQSEETEPSIQMVRAFESIDQAESASLTVGGDVQQSEETESSIQMVRSFESINQAESTSLTVGGDFEQASLTQSISEAEVEQASLTQFISAAEVDHSQVGEAAFMQESVDTSGRVSFEYAEGEIERQWTKSTSEQIGVVSRQDAFEGSGVSELIRTVDTADELTETELFSEDDDSGSTGFWRPARTRISLAEVLQWSDAPDQYSEQLVSAITQGADEGVQALAVALLGEVDRPESDTITALKQAAITGAPMVKAAALDALVLQGQSDSESLDGLLSLLAGDDPKIRAQAGASLLRMADTQWCDDAIEGLHQLLDDQNDEVVAVAATSLSEFGLAAVHCRERLTAIAATTSSELVLEATSMALSRIPRTAR